MLTQKCISKLLRRALGESHMEPRFPGLRSQSIRYAPLVSLWQNNDKSFISSYARKFESKFGKIPIWKLTEVEKHLAYGKFSHSFIWNEFHDCKIVIAVPFYCKSKICLFCYLKKLFCLSFHLYRIIIHELPCFHIVSTLP